MKFPKYCKECGSKLKYLIEHLDGSFNIYTGKQKHEWRIELYCFADVQMYGIKEIDPNFSMITTSKKIVDFIKKEYKEIEL